MHAEKMTHDHLVMPATLKEAFQRSPFYGRSRVYKFCEKQHVSGMVNDGVVKIGTLWDFRKHESASTRDQSEGLEMSRLAGTTLFDALPATSIAHELFSIASGSNFIMTNTGFSRDYNCYAFCFSYELSASVAQSFSYDAVVEISDIYLFAQKIIELHSQFKGWGYMCGPVSYAKATLSARLPAREELLSAFEKDVSFKENKEGRVIFLPPRHYPDELKPFIFQHRKLRRLLVGRPFPTHRASR